MFQTNKGQQEWNQRLSVRRIVIAERFLVPFVMLPRTRTDISDREHSERQRREIPAQHSVPRPFEAFTKVVRSRNVFKHSAMGDLVIARSVRSKAAKNCIRVPVDRETRNEENSTDNEARVVQPRECTVGTGYNVVRRLDVAIQNAEQKRH